MTRSPVQIDETVRTFTVPAPFSLNVTCGPVFWTATRSPRHRWENGALTWVGWESDRAVWRRCRQTGAFVLHITGSASRDLDAAWATSVLGTEIELPAFGDPVMGQLAAAHSGLHPYCDGSVFEGVITAIVGQSISVAAAAVTQAKLAVIHVEPVEVNGQAYRPLPRADQLASSSVELIRASGVTWKRAEGIRFAAQEAIAGNLPDDAFARAYPDETVAELMKLPQIGRWTAESIVLWGVGAPNAHPTGDIALLRAARSAYAMPELTLKELDVLAERWRPARGLAARLLWTELFGPAPG